MATIEHLDKTFDPGTERHLAALITKRKVVGPVAVQHDSRHEMRAALTGNTAFIMYLDHKKGVSKRPSRSVDRTAALKILTTYLNDNKLDSDFDWVDANLPYVKARRGCLPTSAALFFVLAVAAMFIHFALQ